MKGANVKSKLFHRYILYTFTGSILILVVLALVSCANNAPKITPTSTPTVIYDTPISNTGNVEVPQVTCTEAVQMIEQNQVGEVKVYKDTSSIPGGPDFIESISIYLRTSQQSNNNLLPGNERAIGPYLPHTCKSQIASAVQYINKRLQKDKQVQVSEYYVPKQQ